MTQSSPAAVPRVGLLATGGTIVCRPDPDGRLVPGVPVIVTSRCPYGLPQSPYGGPGGCASLDDFGVLRAGHLNSPKARLATMVGLHETSTITELRSWLRDID